MNTPFYPLPATSKTASSIDDLLAEFGTDTFTLADYQLERARLERLFLDRHGVAAEDIDVVIRRGALRCADPLVEDWVALQALAPYVGADSAQHNPGLGRGR